MVLASCGSFHTLSLDEKGGLWSWGSGVCGQLGMGGISDQFEPTLVPGLKGMSALVAGSSHSLAFPQEGGLLVFGLNCSGQLGLNHTNDQVTLTLCPVQPALPHSLTRSKNKSARFL